MYWLTFFQIFKARGSVGAITIEDIDHDGFAEVVIPVVASNKLVIFSYSPAEIDLRYFVDETRKIEKVDDMSEDYQ